MTDVVHSKDPIRLFKSDVLEFFTHVSPVTVLVIYLPVIGYALVRGIQDRPAAVSWLVLPGGVLLGLVLWTLAEYVLHRFLFHFTPRTPWQERVSFLFHGVHHAQPMVKTRLVMPPVVSIPLALLFYGLFTLVFGGLGIGHWIAPTFAGFGLGYVLYDMTHYSLHHFKLRWGYFNTIRLHHMRHHGQTPNQRFGVTNVVWDRVFGTYPRD